MPVIEQTVVIARAVTEVFDFLMTAENLPRWDSSIVECRLTTAGPVAVGSRYSGTSKILGRRMPWTTEVTEYVPGVRSASTSVDGPLRFTVSYDLAETPAGTSLTYRIAAESGLGGAFGRAMEPIVEKAQRKVVQSNLAALADLLDQRAA